MREAEADAWFLIQSGIERVHDHRKDIDETTARIIAFNLAPTIVSNLALYAQTGGQGPHTDNKALRAEYLPIYNNPETPEDIRELIDWLGAHLVHRENPVPYPYQQPAGPPRLRNLLWSTKVGAGADGLHLYVRADQPPELVDALPDTLSPLLREHGDALIAFLTLPDVDATSPDLEESFQNSYRDTYQDRDEAMRGLLQVDEIEKSIAQIVEDFLGGEFVYLDRDRLWKQMQDFIEVVELNDHLHAFDK